MKLLSRRYRTISDVENILMGGFIRESRRHTVFNTEIISGKLYFGEKANESVRVRALYRGNTGIIISPEESGDDKYERLNTALENAERAAQTGYHKTLASRAMLLTTELLLHLIFTGLAIYSLTTCFDIDSRPLISLMISVSYVAINPVISRITTQTLNGM